MQCSLAIATSPLHTAYRILFTKYCLQNTEYCLLDYLLLLNAFLPSAPSALCAMLSAHFKEDITSSFLLLLTSTLLLSFSTANPS